MLLSEFKTVEQLAAAIRTLLVEDMAMNKGYIGGAWQKDPIRLGYSDIQDDEFEDTALSAGANDVDGAAVPSGEIWVITNLAFKYSGTSPTQVRVGLLRAGSNEKRIFEINSPTSGLAYDRQGYWILEPTDKIRLHVEGATLNDDLYGWASGFRVDIDL